jgi:hypothetical protein
MDLKPWQTIESRVEHRKGYEVIICSDMTELSRVYPVRNQPWKPGESMFYAEASELGIAPGGLGLAAIKDPWNRKIPDGAIKCHYNKGDVMFWKFTTTVEGQPVECQIFND